jgi:3',5'-cyclic AMP phosphodiesterase CpdA
MRTIIHVSDLHFGRVDKFLLAPLITYIEGLKPHLIIVSGDLTQRAKSGEFQEARAFLDKLPSPKIVVPGNHDVPLFNVIARFTRSLTNYRRYITEDLEPFYTDDEIAALGMNTARAFALKHGRLSEEQIDRIQERMCVIDERITKILVTHHPFDFPEHSYHKVIVGRAHRAMEALGSCGVHVILSGHLHVSHVGHAATRFKTHGRSTLIIQAGTATSIRSRGEPNAFNVLRVNGKELSVDEISWSSAAGIFVPKATERFKRSAEGWTRLGPEGAPAATTDDEIVLQA